MNATFQLLVTPVLIFIGLTTKSIAQPSIDPTLAAQIATIPAIDNHAHIQITLPIFFALTGLRVQRHMFSPQGLSWLAIILLVAVTVKLGGAMLAARASGMQSETC